MDKLTRYNQKLLAIIGTSIIVGAVILMLVGVGGLLISMISSGHDPDAGIQVNVDNDKISQETKVRTQAITFDTEYQLDTAKALYLIPISQVNLENEERIKLEKVASYEYSSYDYTYHYGLFNNFILFDVDTGSKIKIFNEKVAITRWSFAKFDSLELLLFKGTKNDTNNDKILDDQDFQSIYVYYLDTDELIEHSFETKTVLDFEPLNKSKLISIKVGIDKNADFEFDRDSEPQEIFVMNVQTKGIENLISSEVKKDIQRMIDQ